MELGSIVANQVIIIFGLIIIGFFLTRKNMIGEQGVKNMTSLLLYVVTPCILIKSYRKEFEISEAKQLVYAAFFTLVVHIIAIIISTLVFYKKDENLHYRVNIFSSVYSNCGFMAIPLMNAVMGDIGVFYGSMYLAVFTVIYWIHGVYVCTGGDRKEISLKKCFINPGFMGTALSMVLFATGFWFRQYPAPVESVLGTVSSIVDYMAEINTPIAMIVLGYYLANINFIKCLKKPSIYIISLLRLVIIPVISIGVAFVMQLEPMVAKAVIIPAACPVATVATLFAARFNLDAEHSAEIVSFTTLLSIVTIPGVVMLAELVIK